MRSHWLKTIGHARGPLPDRWVEAGRTAFLERTGFPRRPRMAPGDRLVYYAAVWRRVFAVVEVEATGVAARSMSQQSHIRIGGDHYTRAVEAIASVAAA